MDTKKQFNRVPTGISMTPVEVAIVAKHIEKQHLGNRNFSLAIRQIIHEWNEMKNQKPNCEGKNE